MTPAQPDRHAPDRNLALELARVNAAAKARGCSPHDNRLTNLRWDHPGKGNRARDRAASRSCARCGRHHATTQTA